MARIKDDDIDLLRDRADIVEIISAYTAMKKSGGHTFKGLCPFHAEKTPSFSVDTAKGLFWCFGCSEGGNVYHFVQKQENLPFPEAVEWVARKTGFELHYEEMGPGQKKAHGIRARVIEANRLAADFFHPALMNSPDAAAARQYLEGRGFGKEVAERWQLGYSPGRDSLCKYLLSKGFSQEEITQADLGRISDRDGALYDTFRQRVMFPTWNRQDDVVAFGARALGDQQPKYLNTSETPAFSKSREMYGLNRAKSAIARSSAVVVEGYTDVIALHEAGITEAVATNGVALGETHFELLKKFSERAVLMFDADAAGAGATERGFGIHHRIGLEVLVAPLPPGRDPADLVREDGPDAVKKVIEAAQPLIEFKLEQTIAKLPLDTPEARSRAVRQTVEVLGLLPDPIARHEYAFMVARRIGVEVETVQQTLAEARGRPSEEGGNTGARTSEHRVPGHIKVEREALRLLLDQGPTTVVLASQVDEGNFTAPPRREVYRAALEAAQRGLDPARVASNLSPDARSLFSELTVGTATSEPRSEEEIREVFMRLRIFRLEREIKARRNTLQEVNPMVDAERHDALFTELVGLEAERRDLLRDIQGAA